MVSDLPGAERSRHRDHALSRSSFRVDSVTVLSGSSTGIRNLDRRMTSSNTNATAKSREQRVLSVQCFIQTEMGKRGLGVGGWGSPTTYPRSGPLRPQAAPWCPAPWYPFLASPRSCGGTRVQRPRIFCA